MPSDGIHPSSDTNPYREAQRHRAAYFNKVVTAYAECREYPPIVAITHDDDLPPNRKLTPKVIEFLVDVELATHKALDHADLFSAWLEIIADEVVPMRTRARVTDLCARVYMARRLQPSDYFRTIKTRKDRRNA